MTDGLYMPPTQTYKPQRYASHPTKYCGTRKGTVSKGRIIGWLWTIFAIVTLILDSNNTVAVWGGIVIANVWFAGSNN